MLQFYIYIIIIDFWKSCVPNTQIWDHIDRITCLIEIEENTFPKINIHAVELKKKSSNKTEY